MLSGDSVAAVIPCYNSSAFLGEAIASALAQTHQAIEIVVVNDGSTDAFAEAVAPYAGRIRVIDQDNQGLAAARNRGIDATASTLVAFLDADDRWHPEKIAKQVEFLRARPRVAVVFCDRNWIDGSGRPIAVPRHRRPQDPSLRTLIEGNFIQPSTVLLRRDALEGDRFERGMHGTEDWDLWLRLSARCEFGYVAEPLVDYRVHGENMSARTEQMMNGFLTVIGRAISRGLAPDLLIRAEAHRRRLLEALGHCAYEREDWVEARRLFAQSHVQWNSPGWRRWLLSSLPRSIQKLVRQLRRRRASARSL